MRSPLLIAALFLTLPMVPATAQTAQCPPTDRGAIDRELDPLMEQLTNAPSEREGDLRADDIWTIWRTAPDSTAQDLLNRGVDRIRIADYAGAERILDELITYCPRYPEGWNQRAFARFLAGNYDGALEDLDQTLELEPRHFAAIAGRGLSLLRQGRTLLGQKAIREAIAIHPWMRERHLLPPDQKT